MATKNNNQQREGEMKYHTNRAQHGTQIGEEITSGATGISIQKVVTQYDQLSKIAFTISSERDDQVTVRLIDQLPSTVSVDQIGLHPDFHGESWTIQEGQHINFEHSVDPGDGLVTLYAVQTTDREQLEAFLREPDIEVRSTRPKIAAATGGTEAGRRSGTPIDSREEGGTLELTDPTQRNIERTSGDELSSDDSSNQGSEENDIRRDRIDESHTSEGKLSEMTMTEENNGQQASKETIFDSEFDDEDEELEGFAKLLADSHPISQGEVAATMVAEFDDDAIDHHTLSKLQEQLFELFLNELNERDPADEKIAGLHNKFGGASPAHLTVRLERVESQLNELGAYTDALREFIDEEGTGTDVLNSMQSDLGEVETECSRISEQIATLRDSKETMGSKLGTVSKSLDSLEEVENHVGSLEGRIEEQDDELSAVVTKIDTQSNSFESSISSLSEEMENTVSEIRSIQRVLATTEQGLGQLDRTVDTLEDDVDDSKEVIDDSIADLEKKFSEIQSMVDHLESQQQRVGNFFQSLAADLSDEDD